MIKLSSQESLGNICISILRLRASYERERRLVFGLSCVLILNQQIIQVMITNISIRAEGQRYTE